MLKALKDWYLATFLPFEDPSHPLYAQPDEFCDELSDWVDAELEEQRPIYKDSMVRMSRERFEAAYPGRDWDSLPKA